MKKCRLLLFVIVSLLACTSKQQTTHTPQKEVIITGLNNPWSIAFINENEALITEKDSNLLYVNLETKEKTVVQNFPTDLVDSIRVKDFRDNSGMFEVVLHPLFSENNLVYISYVAENNQGLTTTKVIRAKLIENKLTAVVDILVAKPFSEDLFHYGGGMCFGKDGKLYITIGERLYNEKDEPAIPIAQDLADRRGKIYRFNDDGSTPTDNPNFDGSAIDGLYAIGIRAAQGITCHPIAGDIWFSEHGSRQGDELNILKPGANYGWPIKTTGQYRHLAYQPPAMETTEFAPPTHAWLQTVAPTGLCFYTGDDFPAWKGNLMVAGLSRGSLWRMTIKENEVVSAEELFMNDRVRLRKVAQSPAGRLYVLTDENDGKLVQIVNK